MTMTADTAPPPSIAEEVARLRRVQNEGSHDEVVRGTGALLRDFPENRDLLLLEATSLRLLGRIDEALATLDRLGAEHPEFSLMHQERGLCHVARKAAPAAIEALLAAVNRNPALPMSWRMLEGVYRIAGDPANAATAAEHVATLRDLPPAVVTATSLFADGDLIPAEEMVRAYLVRHGDHPEAMRLLARIGMARDVLDDAEALLEAVLAMVPDHLAARLDYAQTLVQRHKYREARGQIAMLLAREPDNLTYRQLSATCAVGLGEHDSAIDLYRGLLAELPGTADLHLWLGHALKTVGRLPEAIASYRAAASARADFGDAYWSLANLKTYRFEAEEIARMLGAEADPATAIEDRVHLSFALGKAFEDRGDHRESWTHYARGNALKRVESRYRPELMESNTRLQKTVCTPDFFAQRRSWGSDRADPIFVVGLPRSGSTLIEQILASHSQIEGTQELPEIQRLVLDLQGREPDLDDPLYPAALADLTREDCLRLGEAYLADTQVYRAGSRHFIDKMPNNFRHIGLIHLILPNARIIDARREPMACCFSNLKQLFAQGQEFSYGIEDIARYYRTYLELMAHWDAALPGRVLRVQHEEVIADLDGSVRRILSHLGLPFEHACLDFHKNARSVRTPSSEQVRRPIFREGLDQWTNFAKELEPLGMALGDARERYLC